MPARLPEFIPPPQPRTEVYERELKGVINQELCSVIFGVSRDKVKRDIQEGRLYAEKWSSNPDQERSGYWIIPYSAAEDLYGTKDTGHYVRRNHVSSTGA